MNNKEQGHKLQNTDIVNHPKADSAATEKDVFYLNDRLTALMTNKIRLDTLLDSITHQEKVKVVAVLKSLWDDSLKVYKYYDSNFAFQMKVSSNGPFPTPEEANSILIDGKYRISFDDYQITCFNPATCEDYGFNINNSLENPVIIEVCGRQFLYSDISFACNGMGCGCVLTMIYDLKTHKPTFIENYRMPYDGFFISDFNNDNNPDLLVIEKSTDSRMKGFDTDEFEVKLYAYTYSYGKFMPVMENKFSKPCQYELYGIGEYSYYTNLTYAIITDNWFRQ